MDEDEYVFTSSLEVGSGKEAEAFHKIAKKALANKLRKIFQGFSKAMIAVHGKDLLADEGDSAPASGSTTPATTAPSAPSLAGLSLAKSSSTPATTTSKTSGKDGKTFNTAVVKADGEFMTSADDLFEFLTNEAS